MSVGDLFDALAEIRRQEVEEGAPAEARARDAQLEAEAWKATAARWRKRALREGGAFRRECRRLEELLDDVNERFATEAEALKESAKDADIRARKAEWETKETLDAFEPVRRSRNEAVTRAEDLEKQLAAWERRVRSVGSLEALVVERDALKEEVVRLKADADRYEKASSSFSARSRQLEKELQDIRPKLETERVLPAKAKLRVLATRLGIDPSWKGYSNDDALTEELDRRIFELQRTPEAGY